MPTAGILDSWQSPQAWVRAIGNTLSTVTTGPIEPGLTHGFACVIENPQVSRRSILCPLRRDVTTPTPP